MFRRRAVVTRRALQGAAAVLLVPVAIAAQGGRGGGGGGARGAGGAQAGRGAQPDTTRGFPIADRQVIIFCTRCHERDSTGIVQRLSFMRKTPEGWETSVRRMVMLHDVKLDPDIARSIVRYLSNQHGLAPAEARAGRFDAERRMVDYRYAADTATERTCRACHSMGRVVLQRRTREEWELLLATHRGLYPDVDFQAFRRGAPPPAGTPAQPHPMDAAVTHLARAFPLRTPEWAAWSASMRPPPLVGEWMLTGTEPGRGAFYGRVTVSRSTTADEFTTRAAYRYAKDGRTVTRTGQAIVYTGFQWRGRSLGAEGARGRGGDARGRGRASAASSAADTLREVMFVEPGWQEMSGRWFAGAYDELGMDVALTRVGANPALAGVSRRGLRSPSRAEALSLFGVNFPRDLKAEQIDLGPGVRVTRVVHAATDSIALTVSVDSSAAPGARDLFLAGASLRGGLVIYDKVSRIKVTPAAGMARVGGANFPKQLQQFDAVAWHHGADGKPDTADDFEIGPVDVTWSLEEYGVTYDDDDVRFVGAIDARGLFTPALDGPNPARSGGRNNIGDVWVVATWQPPEPNARPLRARAHLVVTVPLYMRWGPFTNAP
jgi:quinohemoprotein amine dehydrogenase